MNMVIPPMVGVLDAEQTAFAETYTGNVAHYDYDEVQSFLLEYDSSDTELQEAAETRGCYTSIVDCRCVWGDGLRFAKRREAVLVKTLRGATATIQAHAATHPDNNEGAEVNASAYWDYDIRLGELQAGLADAVEVMLVKLDGGAK